MLRIFGWSVLVGVLLGIGLVLLALPFRSVPGEAETARDDLQRAVDALRAGELETARTWLDSAQGHVGEARGVTHGLSGDVWQWVPVAGGGISDVRLLVEALDDSTSVVEAGIEVYPALIEQRAKGLVEGESVDLPALTALLDSLVEAGGHLRSAEAALNDIEGDLPFIGATVRTARDSAMAEIEPMTARFDEAEPLLTVLPSLLGEGESKKYLVSVLNPAELRFSGGAALAMATLEMTDGQARFEDLGNIRALRNLYWKKVPGNPFHKRGRLPIQNATWSPYWSVSGEELLRAWSAAKEEELDGVLVIDVPALASLFEITGPVQTEQYGTLDSSNVVRTFVGSYDIYNDTIKRRDLNRAVMPLFREKLFEGGKFASKFQALGRAADARRFALYLRDPLGQEAVRQLGIDGDLSDTEHDYLGVFTQNVNAAKSDYYQQRAVTSQVTLRKDGSAQVRLRVKVDNTAGPYPYATPDPGFGYFTRLNVSALGVFFPVGAEVSRTAIDGEVSDIFVRQVGDRPYYSPTVTIPAGGSSTLEVEYVVPKAAVVTEGGGLSYRLAVDPQGTVLPQAMEVTVQWPQGYAVRGLPAQWQRLDKRTARWQTAALTDSPRWELTGSATR